jgi:hypothetical protein
MVVHLRPGLNSDNPVSCSLGWSFSGGKLGAISQMQRHPNSMGRQGVKPRIPLHLDVVAEAAIHKAHL